MIQTDSKSGGGKNNYCLIIITVIESDEHDSVHFPFPTCTTNHSVNLE